MTNMQIITDSHLVIVSDACVYKYIVLFKIYV